MLQESSGCDEESDREDYMRSKRKLINKKRARRFERAQRRMMHLFRTGQNHSDMAVVFRKLLNLENLWKF